MWGFAHLLGYIALAVVVAQIVPAAVGSLHGRSRNARMSRIARLELDLGVGLDFARDWLDSRPIKRRSGDMFSAGEYFCYGCRAWKDVDDGDFHKLCRACRKKAVA